MISLGFIIYRELSFTFLLRHFHNHELHLDPKNHGNHTIHANIEVLMEECFHMILAGIDV